MELDLSLIDHYDSLLTDVELTITRTAKIHYPHTFHRLRTVPGIGKILALVILYEIHHIDRFPSVGHFVSYCRLVKCAKLSDCDIQGGSLHQLGVASAGEPSSGGASRS